MATTVRRGRLPRTDTSLYLRDENGVIITDEYGNPIIVTP